jgi:ABC-type glycerol-3-phosphate transport system permease component
MIARKLNSEKVFIIFNYLFLLIICVVMLYPFVYTLSVSISDPVAVTKGQVKLLPVGFSAEAYKTVSSYSLFLRSYLNTFLYSVLAAVISIVLLLLSAYPLSIPGLKGRRVITLYLTITMFFGGGMIPFYLVIRNLHMLNTIWAVVLPGALGVWNIILCRTFIQGLPDSLREAAKVDGANEWQILFRVVVPLSKALIAVMCLYTVVGQWNQYFGPMLYLTDDRLYPLQVVLRRMLVDDTLKSFYGTGALGAQPVAQSIRSASIILIIAPIVCMYPFLQKYFTKGVMIGSIKG